MEPVNKQHSTHQQELQNVLQNKYKNARQDHRKLILAGVISGKSKRQYIFIFIERVASQSLLTTTIPHSLRRRNLSHITTLPRIPNTNQTIQLRQLTFTQTLLKLKSRIITKPLQPVIELMNPLITHQV